MDYEAFGGVSFHWRQLTSSGHNRRPNGSVVDAYTACLPKEDASHMQVKSFLNTRWVGYLGPVVPCRAQEGGISACMPVTQPVSLSVSEICVAIGSPRFGLHMGTPHQASIRRGRRGSPRLVDEHKMKIKPGVRNAASWDR